MKAGQIMTKTMQFVWLKLGYGLAMTLIAALGMGLFALIGGLFGSGGGVAIMICIWLIIFSGIFKLVDNYFGYLIKAGHVAVVAEAVTTGQVPEKQFEFGKNKVKERFATSNVYFVVDKLVSGAVRQLKNAVGKVGGLLENIPGMEKVVDILQTFIGIALGYIDECCLGYCFIKTEQNAFQASCDGVVIYFQNAKKLLKDAALTTILVMIGTFLSWFVPFLLLALLCKAFDWSLMIAVILALFIGVTIKSAFIDTYVMVKMMTSYMEVAPSTTISFDLYGKLSKLSSKFKELFGRAQGGVAHTAATGTEV